MLWIQKTFGDRLQCGQPWKAAVAFQFALSFTDGSIIGCTKANPQDTVIDNY